MELKRKNQNDKNMWTKFDNLVISRLIQILNDAVQNKNVLDKSLELKKEMVDGGITRRRAAMKLLEVYMKEQSSSL